LQLTLLVAFAITGKRHAGFTVEAIAVKGIAIYFQNTPEIVSKFSAKIPFVFMQNVDFEIFGHVSKELVTKKDERRNWKNLEVNRSGDNWIRPQNRST
jgi:hypothetical protein